MTGPSRGGGHCRLGSCTHRDCAHPQSCLLFRGISVTQLKHLVRRHYLLQRKRGAGRGELAARRFAHHYAPLTALMSESRGSSDSLGGLGAPGRRRWQEGPGEVVAHESFLFLGPHPAGTSRSHRRRVWQPSGAAFDHSLGLQECSPSSNSSLFRAPGQPPLARHRLVQKVNKPRKALMPPCASPLGALWALPGVTGWDGRSGRPGLLWCRGFIYK